MHNLFDKDNIFAVVGASNEKNKYGFKVFRLLKNAGYTVYPVNLNNTSIQGVKAYPTIQSLPQKPDIISVITPPKVSLSVAQQAVEQQIPTIWFQPGAEDDAVLEYLRDKPITTIVHSCILVEYRKYSA